MAVFGAPVAHGNDTERAVRTALAIRDAMPELSAELGRPVGVHIGIAGGQVVASRTGSAIRRQYEVTGETLNLAARLTDAAKSGEILVSQPVWSALADRLEGTEAGNLVVKGFANPVRAWKVFGLRPAAATERSRLVGRHAELRQFGAMLNVCQRSGRGKAVCIRGEAGIGKSRLVEEFQRKAEAAGFACHVSLVLDFGAGAEREPIRALLRSLLDLDMSSDAGRRARPKPRQNRKVWSRRNNLSSSTTCLTLPNPASCAPCTMRWTTLREAVAGNAPSPRWSSGEAETARDC